MGNLDLYERFRAVPTEAQKKIGGGRLKGMTDINPMWRIKILTEQFGPCGFGWKYEITRQWVEQGAGGEAAAFCDINLYIKADGQWSDAIPGTGGSAFVASEKNGLYTSDECFKMALTDALSVACKALGIAADIYWDKDRTKYDQHPTPPEPPAADPKPAVDLPVNSNHIATMAAEMNRTGKDVAFILAQINKNFRVNISTIEQVTVNQFKWVMNRMKKTPDAPRESA